MGIHLISESQPRSDLQTEVADRFSGLTTAIAMIGRADRTLIEHLTRSTGIAVEYSVKRAAGCVIAAENTMVYRATTHRAFSHETFGIELEQISADHIVGQTAAVDRCNKFYALLDYLQGRRNGRIAAIGKECLRFPRPAS